MADIIELLIKAATSYDGGLDKVADALKSIQNATGLSSSQLKGLEQEFQRLSAQGLNFRQIIQSISSSGNNFGTGVGAAAKQIQTSLNQAAQAAQNLNAQMKQTSQLSANLQSTLGNPLQALATGALKAATALGPVGLGIGTVATIATLGAKALIDFLDSQGKVAQATVNMAAQLGISAGQMKRLQVEGNLIGVSFQSMQIAARQLAVAIEEPTGAGKRAAQTLRDLSIATQTTSGQVRQEGAVFTDTIEALAKIEDQTKRTEEATRLFGSRSSAAILLLIGRYKELDETARSLGYGDTTQLQEALAKGEEKINAMTAAWDLFKAKLGERIEPITIKIVERVIKSLTSDDARLHAGTPEGIDEARLQDQKDYATQGGVAKFLNLINGNGLELTRAQLAAANPQNSWLVGALDPMGGLGTAQRDSKTDLAAGAAIAKQAKDSFAKTLEGMAQTIRENTEKIKEDQDKLSRGGLGAAAAGDTRADITSLTTQNAALKANIERARQVAAETAKLTEDAKFPGLQSPVEFRKLIAQRQKDLSLGVAPNLVDASPEFGLDKITESIRKFFAKIGAEAQKDAEKNIKDAESHGGPFDVQNEAYKKQLKQRVQMSESDYSASEQQLKIINDSQRAALERDQQRAIRLAELQGGPGGEGRAIALGTQARVSSATNLRDDQISDIQKQIDAINALTTKSVDDRKQLNELTTQSLQIEASYRKEIDEAHMDAEMKILELQKKELDSYKQQAASIFDALRQPGGRGMQQWFRGQTTDLARGVFSNATAPILQQIGQSMGGATAGLPAPFQALFKGTVLDSARAKTPQLLATDANTAAINANTAALTGRSIGGVSVTGAPGSIAAGVEASSLGGTNPGDVLKLPDSTSALALSSFSKALATSAASPSNPNQFMSGLMSFLSGKGGIGGGGLFAGLNPDAGMTGAFRAGNLISSAADVGTGIYESVNQFGKGGASGIAGGLGAASLTAGQLAGGPSNPIGAALDVFGGIMELFKGLMPDPITMREAQIANQQQFNTYVAPPTLNRSLSASGGYEQITDKYGLPSATTYTSVQVESPFKYQSPIRDPSGLYQNWESAPGAVIEPYQAAAAQPNWMTSQAPHGMTFITNISAMDTQSFLDNSGKIAAAVQKEVVGGHPVGTALQRAVLGS